MDQPQPPATPAPTSAIVPTANAATKRKILFIEDEHFISELYSRAMVRGGYDVTPVIDGQEALTAAKTNQYDIILLDIMVPNMTGTEILRHLRAEVPDLKAKILITTNLEQKEASRKEIESQADGYIIKAEITPKELVKLLDTVR
jgi:CheY-like chemotaxis protein